MDRRNVGDPVAPPRPPKTFPKVHRPRAPEPNTVTDNTNINTTLRNLQFRMDTSNNNNSNNSNVNVQRQQASSPSISSPTTAPLTPLQSRNKSNNNITNSSSSQLMSSNPISTFSRRRPDVRQQQQQLQPQQQSPLPSSRSTTPIVSATNFISNTLSSLGSRTPSPTSTQNNVSLQVPRPENERLPNEYVDAPFTSNKTLTILQQQQQQQLQQQPQHHQNQQQQQQQQQPQTPNRHQLNSINSQHLKSNISTIDGISVLNNNSNPISRPNILPITKQPSFKSNTLCKKEQLQHQFSHCQDDGVAHSGNNGIVINNSEQNSITCPQCKRCRCEECQRPRQLPSRWICNNYCYCSPETIIDYASCLCCVKGLYYHCSNHEMECDSESISCADDPCSCVPYKRTARWGFLSALSLILPCLLCYWPMRGCVSLCAKCYANHSRHGCRCNNNTSNNNNRPNLINLTSNAQTQQPTNHHRRANNNDLTPEKRLLDSSSNEY